MLRHYVALALRNVARAKLYAAISVVGLAVGFGAATLIGLYVHDEVTYDRWLPNHDRIFQVSASASTGAPSGVGPSDLGKWLESDYPQLEHVTRLFRDYQAFFVPSDRTDFKANEPIVWVDANVFGVFRFPVVAGSLDGALDKPDSLVLSRRTAEKYFGKAESAVGKTLLWNGQQPMVVTAVIAPLPSNTHLGTIDVLAAAHAPYSPTALQDRTPITIFGGKLWNSATYLLLKPNERIEPLRESLATLIDRHAPTSVDAARKPSQIWALTARPITAIHLSSNDAKDPEGQALSAVYTVSAIGLLIVLVASINFVNLLTALGVRRALEVGVRKALGAQRSDLFKQFMTESFLYVGVGAAVGLGLAWLALKPLNLFLQRTIDLSMFADARVDRRHACVPRARRVSRGALSRARAVGVSPGDRHARRTRGRRAGGGAPSARGAPVRDPDRAADLDGRHVPADAPRHARGAASEHRSDPARARLQRHAQSRDAARARRPGRRVLDGCAAVGLPARQRDQARRSRSRRRCGICRSTSASSSSSG